MSEHHRFSIQRLSPRGRGIGTTTGAHSLHVEVPGALPGDEVAVELGSRKRKKAIGYLREIFKSSPVRVLPRCAHASFCGGCSIQQMRDVAQLQEKEKTVTTAFAEILAKSSPCIHPILAAADPWNYRNKMEFSFSQNREGHRFLGLMMAASRGRVMNLTECHLAPPWFTDVLCAVRKWWETTELRAYHPPSDQGTFRTLILREGKNTGRKMAMLTVSGNPTYGLKRSHLNEFVKTVIEALPEHERADMSLFVRVQQLTKGHPTQYYEMHLHGPDHLQEKLVGVTEHPLLFKVSPTSFFQPNTAQAQILYRRALEMVTLSPEALVYDLFCGTATLGLIFAHYVEKVVAIELNPHAIFDAQENCLLNHIENVELICGDVGVELQKRKEQKKERVPDLVIVDPPRAGLGTLALEQIVALSPKQILYISCHPASQADNVRLLCEKGYQVDAMQPVDLFPHTMHVENIVVLTHRREI